MEEIDYISVVDVRDYVYCPRVVFFKNVLHLKERTTEAMLYGKERHEEFSLSPLIPRLKPMKFMEDVELVSHRLKLMGKVDLIIVTKYNEYIPVEIKWSEPEKGKPRKQHKAQIVSYALLIEDNFKTVVKRGLIYYSRAKKFIEVIITEGDKRLIVKHIGEIYDLLKREVVPEVLKSEKQCRDCGYKIYCKAEFT